MDGPQLRGRSALDRSLASRSFAVDVLLGCAVCVAGAVAGRASGAHLAGVFCALIFTGPAVLVIGSAWLLSGACRRWAGARTAGQGALLVRRLLVLWLAVIASLPCGLAMRVWLDAEADAWALARAPRVEAFEREHGRRAKHAEFWELVGARPWCVRAADLRYDEFLGRLVPAD